MKIHSSQTTKSETGIGQDKGTVINSEYGLEYLAESILSRLSEVPDVTLWLRGSQLVRPRRIGCEVAIDKIVASSGQHVANRHNVMARD